MFTQAVADAYLKATPLRLRQRASACNCSAAIASGHACTSGFGVPSAGCDVGAEAAERRHTSRQHILVVFGQMPGGRVCVTRLTKLIHGEDCKVTRRVGRAVSRSRARASWARCPQSLAYSPAATPSPRCNCRTSAFNRCLLCTRGSVRSGFALSPQCMHAVGLLSG